jgi:hypothetical protein
MSALRIMRRVLATLALLALLGLLLAACHLAEASAPPGGWYAPLELISCEPGDTQKQLASKVFDRCRARKGCMERLEKALACSSCTKASCCAELKACDREAFPAESPARADAARCACVFRCRSERPVAECVSGERCGPATDPASDRYPALASCLDAHCADVCPKEKGGPPP